MRLQSTAHHSWASPTGSLPSSVICNLCGCCPSVGCPAHTKISPTAVPSVLHKQKHCAKSLSRANRQSLTMLLIYLFTWTHIKTYTEYFEHFYEMSYTFKVLQHLNKQLFVIKFQSPAITDSLVFLDNKSILLNLTQCVSWSAAASVWQCVSNRQSW